MDLASILGSLKSPNGNGNGVYSNETNDFFHAAAGVALMAAGASMILAHPGTRSLLRDALRAAYPDLNLDHEIEVIKKIALEDPFTIVISSLLPDLEKYISLRSM